MCFVLIGFSYEGDDPKLIAKKDTQSECEVIKDGILGAKKDYNDTIEGILKNYEDQSAKALGINDFEKYKSYLNLMREKRSIAIDAIPNPPYSDLDYFQIF